MADPISGPGPAATVWQPGPESSTAPSDGVTGALGRDIVAVLGSLLSVGVLCGVLWWLLVSPPELTKLRDRAVMSEVELGKRFSVDAMYVVLAVLAGLVSGVALSWWRSRDPLLTSALLLVGAGVAAALMALTGYVLGPGDPEAALVTAEVSAHVPERLKVDIWTVYLAWPIGVLAGALVVLLGSVPDSDA